MITDPALSVAHVNVSALWVPGHQHLGTARRLQRAKGKVRESLSLQALSHQALLNAPLVNAHG